MRTESRPLLNFQKASSGMAIARLFLAFSIAAIQPFVEAASVELVSRETTGYGGSEKEAVANALIEAASQVGGVSIDAQNSLRSESIDSDSKSSFREELQAQIRSRSKGLIHSYDIRSVTREDQRWSAKLLVTVAQPGALGSTNRSNLRTIAVLPFRVNAVSCPESARRWEQKLVTHIVQARRFRVLDREFTTELDGEDTRLRSGNTPITELVRIGQQLGADYVIVGEISHFEIKPGSGADSLDEASLIVEYRIIEPATREVRWANTANVNYSRDNLQRLGVRGNRQAQEQLFNTGAGAVATEILDLIYPIKVVRLEPDGRLLLTQGGNRVQTGQWFSIHPIGPSTEDPDTKLLMRPDGPEVALASIETVQEKSSLAKVEKGPNGAVKEGMICRRLPGNRIAAMQQQAQQEARQEEIRQQEEHVKAGKCPACIVRSFRTATGWNIIVKNPTSKPMQINALVKRISDVPQQTPFSLTVPSGGQDTFGIPDAFSTGDALGLICEGFEEPYKIFFQ